MGPEPTRLQLDLAPARAVGTAVGILSAWIGVEHLRLGGGTVLEARWHHRSSTDLDFFFTSGPSHPGTLFLKDFDDIGMDLHRLVRDGVISTDGVVLNGRNHIQFTIGDVPVSLVRTELYHGDPCDEVEYNTGVILGGTRDVLTKKMYNRLGINHLAIQRDAYDFAVARTLAPDDLAYAWSTMTEDMKGDALAAYRDLAEGSSHPRFRGLENARHDGLAADLWNEVLRMLETNLEYVPPLSRGDDDTSRRSGHGR